MGQPERGKLPFSVKIAILCVAVSRGSYTYYLARNTPLETTLIPNYKTNLIF